MHTHKHTHTHTRTQTFAFGITLMFYFAVDRNPDTPDSAFGANLRPGSGRLSPEARKRLWKVVHELPGKQTVPVRDKHTVSYFVVFISKK